MMSGKNKMPLNIIIDFVMLMAMALVSISGFILEIVIPSRHAVRFQDATPWCSHLLGLGRHDWGNIHLWAGVVLVTLLAIHILLHIKMVSAFHIIRFSYPTGTGKGMYHISLVCTYTREKDRLYLQVCMVFK